MPVEDRVYQVNVYGEGLDAEGRKLLKRPGVRSSRAVDRVSRAGGREEGRDASEGGRYGARRGRAGGTRAAESGGGAARRDGAGAATSGEYQTYEGAGGRIAPFSSRHSMASTPTSVDMGELLGAPGPGGPRSATPTTGASTRTATTVTAGATRRTTPTTCTPSTTHWPKGTSSSRPSRAARCSSRAQLLPQELRDLRGHQGRQRQVREYVGAPERARGRRPPRRVRY